MPDLEGLITTIESVACRVDTPRGEYVCTARGKLTEGDTGKKKPLAVGDRVEIEETGHAGEAVIIAVRPRRTRLSRCHPANPRLEQVTVANVDQALIVASILHPPLTVGFIDRCIISADYGGIEPLLCINKIDLAEEESCLAPARIYERIGYRVVLASARTGAGIDELREVVRDRVTVLAGHSGVGKSSLINALQPGLELRTAPVGWKGKHCTVRTTLMRLSQGGYIVDTPGIRELQPWDIEQHEVQQFFPEIWALSRECRMPDCIHIHEPGCAVRDALDRGALPAVRYESYAGIVDALVVPATPRRSDVDDPLVQIPRSKRRRSRRAHRQAIDKMIDEQLG